MTIYTANENIGFTRVLHHCDKVLLFLQVSAFCLSVLHDDTSYYHDINIVMQNLKL